MTAPHLKKSIGRSPLQPGFRFGALALVLVCLALPPASRALLPPPPPDGGYLNGNTAEGDGALFNLTTGEQNTAVGFNALRNNSGDLSTANTAIGYQALFANTGLGNTACGHEALFINTTGRYNTAIGLAALFSNLTGDFNTATGEEALFNNTTGNENTATGLAALSENTTGSNNTATGGAALQNNTGGNNNTASGTFALAFNSHGNNNTAVGFRGALNTTGANNTAIGHNALANNTIGSANIALGKGAGVFLTTGNNNIDIGSGGIGGESNTIRIGSVQTRTFIKGISGVALAGAPVVVNAAGQLGVAASSAHFKHEIRPMDKESEAILALKPVSFCYDQDIDEQGLTQFGLVAEEVEKVNPDLVVRDTEGKPYSVRYDQVNAMLLNEFLKEHRKNEEQGRDIQEQKATIAFQQKQIDALAAGLQKVSAQLEASKPAPQVVNNP